jgi:Flp pilus assembly pilin Flp
MPEQQEWRFCHKCQVIFFDGSPNKGVCAGGGAHESAGFDFVLPHGVPETATAQRAWRFCVKCGAMFFDGSPNKGTCPAGGPHAAAGFEFVLPHDVPETATAQRAWRFCVRCGAMFFDGFSNKGACAVGGGHAAAGFNFVLPHIDDEIANFDTGPLTSNLPLGGSVHLVVRKNGNFIFSGHAHDSGFDNIEYALTAVLMTPTAVAFTFQHTGHLEGTVANPFGTPNRNDDPIIGGNNPAITNEWGAIPGATLVARISGQDTLVGSMTDILNKAATQLGTAAAAAVIALVL